MDKELINALYFSGANVNITMTLNDLRCFLQQVIDEKEKRLQEEAEETYLTRKEASMMLGGAALSTLWRWEKTGYLVPTRIGSKIFYRKSDVVNLLTT
jgi:hypothetical protein